MFIIELAPMFNYGIPAKSNSGLLFLGMTGLIYPVQY
jgi:hypothetical protein